MMRTCLLLLALSLPAASLTADQLIVKNIEARGGLQRLRAIQSLRLIGKVVMGTGDTTEMGYRLLLKRGRCRSEGILQGLTAITAWDGQVAWRLSPFGGRRDPERLPPDQAKQLAWAADLDGPLVDYQAKGNRVEYLGTQDVDGTLAHKLRVTRKSGDVEYIYLDPDYFLEIRIQRTTRVRGVEEFEEIDLGNYEQVQGVYLPFSRETGGKTGPKWRKVLIEKAEANVELEDSLFRFPEGNK